MSADSFEPILLTRPLDAGRETLAAYRDDGGYQGLERALREQTPAALCAEVTASGLRGRGGASFPTGRKWELALRAEASVKHVVANGGEHEPGSRKDRALLSSRPHTVIEGMALAAWATGASRGYLYVIEDMREAIDACEAALDEARSAGWLGRAIGGVLDFDVELTLAPSTYVAGEETAALEVIEGKPAKPREKPPYPGERGVHGQPTTVNNVETLAHVPGIVRRGSDWFRTLGVEGSAGTMLFTLGDEVARPGVYELPFGATFRELIDGCGGGLRGSRSLKAILPALSSGFLTASAVDAAMTHASLTELGSSLGCGGVSLLAVDECIVERTRDIAHFFRDAQCGQCPPCRMETSTLAAILDKLIVGEAGDYTSQAERITGFTKGKGRCSLIEMAAAPVLSALKLFPDDFAHHAEHGKCAHAT